VCGVVGIVASENVNQLIYDALIVLQHRGQDAAGMMTFGEGRFNQRKGNGLVSDVFRQHHMERLKGNIGIGHCRYPTAGSSSPALAQPFYVNTPYGIALAHNGNLTNTQNLKREVFEDDLRHMNTDSDSEVMLNVFAHELQKIGKLRPSKDDIFSAVEAVHRRCSGGYAVVAMIANYGIVGFRDPHGIRPLVYGYRINGKAKEYMIASESVALDGLGFKRISDVKPGQAVFISSKCDISIHETIQPKKHTPCIFEHVYFSRPDSIIDDISVYKSRLRMGEKLADKILKLRPENDIDVVIPIPDTSRVSAQVIAYKLGIKFREGLIKNRYIGRTFIMPGQNIRKKSVRQKLNAIRLEFKGKNVLLVDDSIVRGTTSYEIIQMARDAGARRVYIASAAPPVRYPNVYGIDMPSANELIAHNRTVEEVREEIGADWLIYQDIEDLVDSAREGNPEIDQFECSVFDGNYVTGDIDSNYLDELHERRNDANKNNVDKNLHSVKHESAVVDLYNDAT
jgi:amidophosphoribosyltransferase